MNAIILPALPLAGALLVAALPPRTRLGGPVAVAILVVTLALGAWAAASEPASSWPWSPLIRPSLQVEGFSRMMVVLVPAIAVPVVAYAAATERDALPRLLALMVAFVGAMLLLVTAADFVALLIGWELVGAISWALIAHHWSDRRNAGSAAQAFLTTRAGDLGLYAAAGVTFAESGSFSFAGLARMDAVPLAAVAAGVVLAAAAKSAQLPFSPWLFSAMAGPTPVSALLHSATMVAAGAYLLIKLSPMLSQVAWFPAVVASLGLATAIAGGVVALLQTHPKRLLAGSTSAQYGFMFMAVGAGYPAAAAAQLVTHAAFKSLLFLGAGTAIHVSDGEDLLRMRLRRAVPLIAALSAIGALALAGVPFLGGAWSKDRIIASTLAYAPWLGAGALVAAFLSGAYIFRYHVLAYGAPREPQEPPATGTHARAPGRVETGAVAALTALTLLLSLLWLPGAGRIFEDTLGGRLPTPAAWEFAASLLLLLLAAAVVVALSRLDVLGTLALPAGRQRSGADWLALPTLSRVLVAAPVLAISRLLAALDQRLIDAGVRGAAATAGLASRLLSLRIEWSVDGIVTLLARSTLGGARASRQSDDAFVDRAVEDAAAGVGVAGRLSRRLQTGFTHQYYVVVALGLIVVVALLAFQL
ncbi:MAG: NADH-quinone oxidoreductase subunit L [Dehalococcoidia bacterium]|nr:NADH-quinone oxidoreductase subunit L [Dehalococcoidia bacterium]